MTSTSFSDYEYQVGGSLRVSAPSYIERQADGELYRTLRAGEFCYVFNSRQMGKSSLRVQTKHRLEQEGFHCASVDMTSIGSGAISPQQWYRGFIAELWRGFNLGQPKQLKAWWQEQESTAPIQILKQFLEDLLLIHLPAAPIVILIDEIDHVLSLPFSMDDFFAFLRFCYNQRAENPVYNRLSFALFGVATPSDLIQNPRSTPFNIGKAIEISGFSLKEAIPLAYGLVSHAKDPEALLSVLLNCTAGQPFLTQKLCRILVHYCRKEGKLYCEQIQPGEETTVVERLVQQFIVDDWEQQDEPKHLRTICDRLLYNENRAGRLLGIYQRLLQGEVVQVDDSPEQAELLLSGLVIKHRGLLRIKCMVYQSIFDLDWVQQKLTALRPYAENLNIWVKHPEDGSRLLRGQALIDAQAWAQGKQLSDLDYRFLTQSEVLDRKETQLALEAAQAQEVSKRLAQQEKSNRQQKRLISALSISLLIALGLGITSFIQYRQALRNHAITKVGTVNALANSAQALYQTDQQLDALIEAIRAKRQLQQLELTAPQDLTETVNGILQQAVYGAVERNQFSYGSELRGVAFSPEGRIIASSATDGSVKLWQPDGKLLVMFQNPDAENGSFGLTFNPRGDRLAVAYGNGTVILWNQRGKRLKTFLAHGGATFGVAFNPGGQVLATVGADAKANLWDAQGQLLRTLTGHQGEVWGVVFSPDGQSIATGSRDKTVKLWRVRDGKLLSTLTGYEGPVRALAFSPNGKVLVTGSDDATIRIWRRDGTLIKAFRGHDAAVQAIAFSSNGEMFATASWDKTVRLWNSDGSLLRTLKGHRDRVWTLAFSADSSTLATGSWDGTIRLWKVRNNITTPFLGHTATVLGVTFSRPDGKLIATASDDRTIKLWSEDGKLMKTLDGHTGEVYDVAFSPDGRRLASTGLDRTIRLWDRSGKLLKILQGHKSEIWDVSFSPDGRLLASASHDETVKLWRVRDGALLETIAGHQGRVYKVAFSPDGQRVLTANEERNAQLWTIDGKLLTSFPGHHGSVYGVNFNPDGTLVATSGADKLVKLWRSDGTLLKILSGHQAPIYDVSFNPDGKLIASASFDGTIKIWQPDGRLVSTLRGHQGRVWDASFSPVGRKLASASEDKTILLWDLKRVLNPSQILADACNWAQDYLQHNQDLSPEDRSLCR
jgi:WD40 repeat protein